MGTSCSILSAPAFAGGESWNRGAAEGVGVGGKPKSNLSIAGSILGVGGSSGLGIAGV